MARRCAITGKNPLFGNKVSHAHNKTRHKQLPNIHVKRLFIPELKRTVRVKLAASVLRTIDKQGLLAYLHKNKLSLSDVS